MMLPGLIPQAPEDPSQQTTVRVGAGIWGSVQDVEEASPGGDFPDIRLYDKRGAYIGTNDNEPDPDAGGFSDVTIGHVRGTWGRQAEYMAVSASDPDAVCISYITTTWPDGTSMGFLGDIGYMCGASWYPSDTLITNTDSASSEAPLALNRTSNCMWIDRDHSKGIKHQGFSFHLPDFSSSKDVEKDGRAQQYADHPETMCSSWPRLQLFETIDRKTKISYFDPPLKYTEYNADADQSVVTNNHGSLIPDKRDVLTSVDDRSNEDKRDNPTAAELERKTKRALAHKEFMETTLVKSSHDQHNATMLCTSETSYGPDFVSTTDGKFCDMAKKELWPLCSSELQFECFDKDTNAMSPAPHGRSVGGRKLPAKSYKKEIKWGPK
jgi:hypothetical protein